MNKRELTFGIVAAGVTFIIGVTVSLLGISSSGPLTDSKSSNSSPSLQGLHAPESVVNPLDVVSESVSELETDWDPPVSNPRLPQGHLLEVGDFHGDEVKARTGEKWLGLYVPAERSSTLKSTVLSVRTVKDELVDQGSKSKTGKRISVKLKPAPILLVKGANTLRPGSVTTVFEGGEEAALGSGSDIELKLREKTYHLKVLTQAKSGEEYISRNDAKLVLALGETEQVLYDLGGKGTETEASWHLIWAGDADGDGKLDLYVNVSYHYNVSQRKLFLSSQARGRELVREEAELITMGC